MVKEQRYLFDVEDITALLYVCQNCGQEIVCKLDGVFQPGPHCVNCHEPLSTTAPIPKDDPHQTLLITIRRVLGSLNARVKIRFVVSDSEHLLRK